jgi:hypothetical protein
VTIAELHGKLATDSPSGVHERMEDLLTSDVFGTMKYAGYQHGFLDWLLKAKPAPIQPSPPKIEGYFSHGRITRVEYRFWPKLKNKREPDLALLFCFDSESALLILIEAKYFSGTSDWDVDEETNPYGITGSQIADQVRGLDEMSKEEVLQWFESSNAIQDADLKEIQKIHLFITMHTLLPSSDYESSTKQFAGSWPVDSYWVSWTSLAGCLRPHLRQPAQGIAELLKDLYALLSRKDLIPFRGFKMDPWYIDLQNPNFWHEKWWSLQPLLLNEYRFFWDETVWQTRPIEISSNGSFWKEQ